MADRDSQRFFDEARRQTLYALAEGLCEHCGIELVGV